VTVDRRTLIGVGALAAATPALRAAGVASEAHLFHEGGHGFGIRLIVGKPAAVWPELVLAFSRRNGWIAQGR
jgi:hypothetical protein